MANWYISPNGSDTTGNGSSGSPWKTPTKAMAEASSGDTIIFKNGTWKLNWGEKYTIPKSGLTLKAENQWQARIVGDWPVSLNTGGTAGIKQEATDRHAIGRKGGHNLIMFADNISDITFDGLFMGEVYGRCITWHQTDKAVSLHNVTIKNCFFDWVYEVAVILKSENWANVGARASGFHITDCYFFRTSFNKIYLGGGNAGNHNLNGKNSSFKRNVVAWCLGEVIVGYAGVDGMDFSENVVINAKYLYMDRIRNARVYNNIIIQPYTEIPPAAAAWGIYGSNEGNNPTPSKAPEISLRSENVQVYNNIVVNAAGASLGHSGQHATQNTSRWTNIYFGHNTVVTGPRSLLGVQMANPNSRDGIANSSSLHNNLFDYRVVGTGWRNSISVAGFNVQIRNNLVAPSTRDTGGLAHATNVKTSNPGFGPDFGTLHFPWPAWNAPAITFNLAQFDRITLGKKFALSSTSPARNAGSTAALTGITKPAGISHDFFGNPRSTTTPDIGAIEFGSTPQPPTDSVTAAISADVTTGSAPLEVDFSSAGSTVTGAATINKWTWDFDDTTTSSSANPTKTFTNEGSYQVSLKVEDTVRGLESTTTIQITVGQPYSLIPAFTQDATIGVAPLTVNFENTSEAAGGAEVTRSTWHPLGKDTSPYYQIEGGVMTFQHTYTEPGTYTPYLYSLDQTESPVVRLGVEGQTITVLPDDEEEDPATYVIEPAFSIDVQSETGVAPVTAVFTNTTATDGVIGSNASMGISEWWPEGFGVGKPSFKVPTSEGLSFTYQYTTPGQYTPWLVVWDDSRFPPSLFTKISDNVIEVEAPDTPAPPPTSTGYGFQRFDTPATNLTASYLTQARPNQMMLVITHLLINGTAAENFASTVHAYGGVPLTLAASDEQVRESGGGQQWIVRAYYLLQPPAGRHDLELTFTDEVDQAIIEIDTFINTDRSSPIRVIKEGQWAENEAILEEVINEGTAGGRIIAAHTTNSDDAPEFVYTGANLRFSSNGGDDATAIAAASARHVMESGSDHTISLSRTGGDPDYVAAILFEVLPATSPSYWLVARKDRTVAFGASPIRDSFTRADDPTTIGGDWSIFGRASGGYDMGIISNQAYNPDEAWNFLYYDAAQFGPDCEAYFTLATLMPKGEVHNLYIRLQGVTPDAWAYSGYLLSLYRYAEEFAPPGEDILRVRIERRDAGSSSLISPQVNLSNPTNGIKFGISAIGSAIKGYIDTGSGWSEILSANDATYGGAGYLGMYWGNDNVRRVDDFGGGTI